METTREPYPKRNTRRKRRDEREQLWQENHLRALRHALWIALLAGQDLGLCEVQGQLTSLLVYVDELQEHLEDLNKTSSLISNSIGSVG